MKITYDRQVDAMYIYFQTTQAEVMTKEIVAGTIFFDYDGDRLAGIEILDASKVLADPTTLKGVTLEELGNRAS
jgi:uncharacterized protein YuzE